MSRFLALLACPLLLLLATTVAAQAPRLGEIRLDNVGGIDEEYIEVQGPPGASLNGFAIVVLGGNGPDSSGVVQVIIMRGMAMGYQEIQVRHFMPRVGCVDLRMQLRMLLTLKGLTITIFSRSKESSQARRCSLSYGLQYSRCFAAQGLGLIFIFLLGGA